MEEADDDVDEDEEGEDAAFDLGLDAEGGGEGEEEDQSHGVGDLGDEASRGFIPFSSPRPLAPGCNVFVSNHKVNNRNETHHIW